MGRALGGLETRGVAASNAIGRASREAGIFARSVRGVAQVVGGTANVLGDLGNSASTAGGALGRAAAAIRAMQTDSAKIPPSLRAIAEATASSTDAVQELNLALRDLRHTWTEQAPRRESGVLAGIRRGIAGLRQRAGGAEGEAAGPMRAASAAAARLRTGLQDALEPRAVSARLISGIAQVAARLVQVGTAAEAAGDQIRGGLGRAAGVLRTVLTPLLPLNLAWRDLRVSVGQAAERLREAQASFASIPGHLQRSGQAFAQVGGNVRAAGQQFQTAGQIATAAFQGMRNAVRSAVQPVQQFQQVQGGLRQAADSAAAAMRGVRYATELVGQGFNLLRGSGGQVMQALREVRFGLQNVGQAGGLVVQGIRALGQGFSGLTPAVRSFGAAAGTVSGAMKVLRDAFITLQGAAFLAQAATNSLRAAWIQLGYGARNLGGVLAGLQQAAAGVAGVFRNAVVQAQTFFQHLRSLQGVGAAISVGFRALGSALGNVATGFSAAAQAAGGFMTGLSKIGAAAQAVWQSVQQLPSALGQVWANIQNIGTAAGGAITTVFNLAKSFVSVAAGAAAAFAGNIPALIQGLAQGLQGVMGVARGAMTVLQGVWNTITGLAGAAVRGAVGVFAFVRSLLMFGQTKAPLDQVRDGLASVWRVAAGAFLAAVGFKGVQSAVDFLKESVVTVNRDFENWTATIASFSRSTALAADIVGELRRRADFTPFPTQQIVEAGQQLISSAHGARDELIGLMDTAEQLAALRPLQGLQGASFAIREAVAGDFESVVERFDISREAIQRWRASGVSNIEAVRHTIEEMGVSRRLVENLAQTFQGATSTVQSFFLEFRRSLAEGLFQGLSESALTFARFIRESGDSIYQTANRIGSVIGGIADSFITGIRTITTGLAPLKEGLRDALGAFQEGNFAGVLAGLGTALGAFFAGVLDQARNFAERLLGIGYDAAANLGKGLLTGLQGMFDQVSQFVQQGLVGLFGGRFLTEVEMQGKTGGQAVARGAGAAIDAARGPLADAAASLSEALQVPLPGGAGEYAGRVQAQARESRLAIINEEIALQAELTALSERGRQPGQSVGAWEREFQAEQRRVNDQINELDERLKTIGRGGIPGLEVTGNDLKGLFDSIDTAAKTGPKTLFSPDLLTNLQKFEDEFVRGARVIDSEASRASLRALALQAAQARVRAPGIEQVLPARPQAILQATERAGLMAGEGFVRAYSEGLQQGRTEVQEIVGGMVRTVPVLRIGEIDQRAVVTLQTWRARLQEAMGDTQALQSLIRGLENPINQVEAALEGLSQTIGAINFQMATIREGWESQMRPLQEAIRHIEAQRDTALKLSSVEQQIAINRLDQQILSRGDLAIQQNILNLRLAGLNRDRDRLTMGRELQRMERRTAAYQGVPREALTRRQQLRLIDTDILRTRMGLLDVEDEEAKLDPLRQERDRLDLTQRQTALLIEQKGLLREIALIPLQDQLTGMEESLANALKPLQDQERQLSLNQQALNLYRGEFQLLQKDAKLALDTATAGTAQMATALSRLADEEFEAVRANTRKMGIAIGQDLLGGMGQWVSDHFGQVLLGAMLGTAGFAFLGPVGLVIGAMLGASIGTGVQKQLAAQNIGMEEIQSRFLDIAGDVALFLTPAMEGLGNIIRAAVGEIPKFWAALNQKDLMADLARIGENLGRALGAVGDLFLNLGGRADGTNKALGETRSVGQKVADVVGVISDAVVWATGVFANFMEMLVTFVQWWQRNPFIINILALADALGTLAAALGAVAKGEPWAAVEPILRLQERNRGRTAVLEGGPVGSAAEGAPSGPSTPNVDREEDAAARAQRDADMRRLTGEKADINRQLDALYATQNSASAAASELEKQVLAAAAAGRNEEATALNQQVVTQRAIAQDAAANVQRLEEELVIRNRMTKEAQAATMEADLARLRGFFTGATTGRPPAGPAGPAGLPPTTPPPTAVVPRATGRDFAEGQTVPGNVPGQGPHPPAAAPAFEAAGEDAGQGFVVGLDASISDAEAASRSLGIAAVSAIQDTLMVRSPSVVMQGIGTDTVAGLVLGVTEGAPLVAASFQQLAIAGMAAFREQVAAESGATVPGPAGGEAGGAGAGAPPVTVTVQVNGPLIGTVQANNAEEREALFADLQARLMGVLQAAGAQVAEQVIGLITGSAARAEPRAPAFLPGVVPGLLPA